MKPILVLLSGLIIYLIIFSSNSFAEADKWARKADMPTERGYLATSAVDGKIYAIGGMKFRDGGNQGICVTVQAVEAYDPKFDIWTKKGRHANSKIFTVIRSSK